MCKFMDRIRFSALCCLSVLATALRDAVGRSKGERVQRRLRKDPTRLGEIVSPQSLGSDRTLQRRGDVAWERPLAANC